MQTFKKFSGIGFFIFCVISIVMANKLAQLHPLPALNIPKQESSLNFNKKSLQKVNLGLKRMLAALIWTHTLAESDHEHYKKKDYNNWMFLRFDLLSTLDELFYEVYIYGGQYLSIIKDDDLGAKIIYDRGLLHYPKDYYLNALTAFHYYFELQDPETALKYYKATLGFPQTPAYFPSLIVKLELQVQTQLKDPKTHGNREAILMAYEFLKTMFNQTPQESPLKSEYEKRLREYEELLKNTN